MINVAAYLRMSSDKQDKSIAEQRTEIVAYAAKRGFKIIAWYSDEAISGWKNKERRGFHQLIADAAGGTFKAVLCWDQARFSRFDPMEANYFWHILRTAGVFLETVKEGRLDWESLGGWLSASVQQHAKAEYCKSLAADVTRGRRASIMAGNWVTPAPYGYRLQNRRLVHGPAAEVETVRRIYRMRTEGLGYRAICVVLNGEKVPSYTGGMWSPATIRNIVTRKTYLGHMVIGGKPKGKFCHITDEVLTFENMHQPIVDQELWDRAQTGKGKIAGQRPHIGGHLSGLLVCGCCGMPLHARSALQAYVCSTYHTGKGCTHNAIGFDRALSLVADFVRDRVLMGSIDSLADLIRSQQKAECGQKNDSTAIQKQIADLDRKLKRAATRLLEVEPSLVKDVRAAMLELQESRQVLEAKLASLKPAKKPESPKDAAKRLWELNDVLAGDDVQAARVALSEIIHHVVIEFAPEPMRRNPKKTRYIPTIATITFLSDCAISSRRDETFWKKPYRVKLG